MELCKIGEFGLINKLRHKTKKRSKAIKIGIGDDCAVIPNSNCDVLTTTDMLIENVHFDLRYFSPEMLGKKAIAVNLSDIAAMGGKPLYILVSLGIPTSFQTKYVEELYGGVESMAGIHNCSIIGGDISKSLCGLIINITVIGEIEKNAFISRAGAKTKDKIFVTGVLGDSAAGLDLLKGTCILKKPNGRKPGKASFKNKIIRKHLLPVPRLEEGEILAKSIGASAMIDLSDGLASDLKRICEESQCGARIFLDKIPLSKAIRLFGKSSKKNIYDYALYGGEDYELLFTINEKKTQRLQKKWQKMKIPITNIGEILDRENGVTLVNSKGKEGPLLKSGYDHFP